MLNKKSQPLILKAIGFMYKKRHIDFFYVPVIFKHLFSDSSSPYSFVNFSKTIDETTLPCKYLAIKIFSILN